MHDHTHKIADSTLAANLCQAYTIDLNAVTCNIMFLFSLLCITCFSRVHFQVYIKVKSSKDGLLKELRDQIILKLNEYVEILTKGNSIKFATVSHNYFRLC